MSVEIKQGRLFYDVLMTDKHEVHEYRVNRVDDMPTTVECFELIAEAAGPFDDKNGRSTFRTRFMFDELVENLIGTSTVVESPDRLTRIIIVWGLESR